MRVIELENKCLGTKGHDRKVALVKMIDNKRHIRYGVVTLNAACDDLELKEDYCWNRGFKTKQEALTHFHDIN